MRHIYEFNRHPISEEMLLGLGEGVGFICAKGGTGGGIFRYMFARFVREAADIVGDSRLNEAADAFGQIGDRWEAVAQIFRDGWESASPADALPAASAPLQAIADLEEAAWSRLVEIVA